MKVTRNIPEQLVIEQSTTGLLILSSLFSLTFIAIGLVFMSYVSMFGALFVVAGAFVGGVQSLAFASRVQLVLDGPRNRVELRTRSFFSYHATIWALDRLERAILQTTEVTKTDKDNKSTTHVLHRPVLIFSAGEGDPEQPVTQSSSTGPAAEQTADVINQWLDRARHSPVDSAPPRA